MTAVRDTDIAVIGVAGSFPGTANVAEFWGKLRLGHEGITFFTADELLDRGVDRARVLDPHYVKAAALVAGAFDFDAAFFGYTDREAELMDPQHRLLLQCAFEVMDQSGYGTDAGRGRVGVFAGTSMNTYLLNVIATECDLRSLGGTTIMLGNDKDYLPTRISYKLNLTGPSINVQTGCSTSLVAIHVAVQSLLAGECDLALAGGASIHVAHTAGYLYEDGLMFSPDGHCRAFDAEARGTLFGDGVGIVLLKRLCDAIADGDSIHAVIKGSAVNNDGANKIGFTAPSLQAQEDVVIEALTVAGVSSDSIGFVEAHGTGTPLGDRIELAALTAAFRRSSQRTGYCALGSVKTNIGHAAAAAGIAGFIKAVLAVEHGEVPPHLHFNKANPEIHIDDSPFFINTTLHRWTGEEVRRAGVSSFGMGGTNAHVVLEQAPPLPPSGPSRVEQLICLSAKSDAALARLADSVAADCESSPGGVLADVAYTLAIGRRAFSHRRAVVCAQAVQAVVLLRSDPGPSVFAGQVDGSSRVCFVFDDELDVDHPAVERLRSEEPAFDAELDHGLALLKRHQNRTDTGLRRLICGYTLGRLWLRWGIRPAVAVGRGMGEYAAACFTEAQSIEDAVRLFLARTADVSTYVPKPEQPALFEDAIDSVLRRDSKCILLQIGASEELNRILCEHSARSDQPVIASLSDCVSAAGTGHPLLRTLAQLWCVGAPVDWTRFYEGQRRRRIPLPTYPFEKRRYVAGTIHRVAVPHRPATTPGGSAAHLYYESWRRAEAVATAVHPVERNSRWLILLDDGELGSALAHRIRAHGGSVVTAHVGSSRTGQVCAEYMIDASDPHGYYAVVAAAFAGGTGALHVVHLPTPGSADGSMERETACRVLEGLQSLLSLARACAARTHDMPLRLSVVTRGAHDVMGGESITLEHRALLAAVIGIPQEYGNIACVGIDLSASVPVDADMLFAELCRDEPNRIVSLRRGYRWMPQYVTFDADDGTAPSPLVRGGTYLITGGLGRMGLALASHLARTVGARLVLTARSEFPPADRWRTWRTQSGAGDRVGRIIERLNDIERRGGAVTVVRADVTDEQAMEDAVRAAEARFGRVHGWIHAAGVVDAAAFASIEHSQSSDWVRIMAPKMTGMLVLDRVFSKRRLDFGVAMSSLAAQLGGIGHIPYAAANLFVDGLAERRRGERPYLAVNWDRWLFDEDAAGAGTAMGRPGLQVADGVNAFDHALHLMPQGRVLVTAGDLAARLTAAHAPIKIERTVPEAVENARLPPSTVSIDGHAQHILHIWKDILGLREVDGDGNFFDSGGDSLLGAELASRIRHELGLRANTTDLFEAPTFARFVQLVTNRARNGGESGDVSERAETTDRMRGGA